MKRIIAGLRKVPSRVCWILGIPTAFVLLLVIDRHLAATTFIMWAGHRAIVLRKHETEKEAPAKAKYEEHILINPSTGLQMVGNNPGGVDTGGCFYGEDPVVHVLSEP